MNTNPAAEYRNLPLAVLTESATNPRRIFEDSTLKELAYFVPGHKIGFFVALTVCNPGKKNFVTVEGLGFDGHITDEREPNPP